MKTNRLTLSNAVLTLDATSPRPGPKGGVPRGGGGGSTHCFPAVRSRQADGGRLLLSAADPTARVTEPGFLTETVVDESALLLSGHLWGESESEREACASRPRHRPIQRPV